jgi:hypothetical protein
MNDWINDALVNKVKKTPTIQKHLLSLVV